MNRYISKRNRTSKNTIDRQYSKRGWLQCQLLLVLQVKHEPNRFHWMKAAQSSLCSDITTLQRNKGHVSCCLFLCFQMSHLQQCVPMIMTTQTKKSLKASKIIFFPLTTTISMSFKWDQILRCFHNWGQATTSCKYVCTSQARDFRACLCCHGYVGQGKQFRANMLSFAKSISKLLLIYSFLQ